MTTKLEFVVSSGRTLGHGIGAVGPCQSVPIGPETISAPITGNPLQIDQTAASEFQRGGFGKIRTVMEDK